MNRWAPLLMMFAGVSVYTGAALAIGLFNVAPPSLVAWLRIATAAVLMVIILRPHPRSWLGRSGATACLFGIATLAMNLTFYEAIARIPLGTAVAIEFFGPVAVAAIGATGFRRRIAPIIAFIGVVIISGATWATSHTGVLLACLTAFFWACYVILGAKVSASAKVGLPVAMSWAAVLFLPLAIWWWPADVSPVLDVYPGFIAAFPQLAHPWLLLIGMAFCLGILSAIIPYTSDQIILKMAGPAAFSLLLALSPVMAAIMDTILFHHIPSIWEFLGIALVVFAVALGSDFTPRTPRTPKTTRHKPKTTRRKQLQ